MSLLDPIDEQMARGDRWAERMPVLTEKRELIISELLVPVSANRVVTTRNLPQIIIEAVNDPFYKQLSHLKGYEIVSLDCRGLKKGDAYGWMARVAKTVEETPNMIVIIENLAEIPSGPLCDDPQYVENLLGHSWKNDKIFFGEYCIDRSKSNLSVILTATPEQKEFLGQRFRTDGYSWCEDFDEELAKIDNKIKKL